MKRLAALLATVAVGASACGGDEGIPPLPEGKFIATTQTLTPKVQLFAEPVTARIDVMLDRERFDPDRVTVVASFKPYERDGEIVRTRRDQGRYTHLRFEYTVRCLVYECLPEVGGGPPEAQPGGLPATPQQQSGGFGERKTFTFDAARVVYDDPDKGKQPIRDLGWAPIQSVSRLNFGDTEVTGIGFPFEASVTPLPEATYRVSPTVLASGLLLGALALLALPAVLVVRALRREPEVAEEPEPELGPLEKALRLVEWSRGEGKEERREALEALAFELDDDLPGLAAQSRRIAWTPPEPDPDAMGLLVESVRTAVAGEEAAPEAEEEADAASD